MATKERKRGKYDGPREGEATFDTRFVSGKTARKLWLVRIPQEVADALDDASDSRVACTRRSRDGFGEREV